MKFTIRNIFGNMLMGLTGLVFLLTISSCVEEVVPYLVVGQENVELNIESELYSVDVKSNVSWTATSDQDWVTLFSANGRGDGKFELKSDSNSTVEERSAIITVMTNDGSLHVPVMVKQTAAEAELELTEEKVFFGKMPSTHKVIVTANHDWTITSSSDWCTVSASKDNPDEITIAVDENNTSEARTAVIYVMSEKDVQHPVKKSIEVMQMTEENYFSVPSNSYDVSNAGKDMYIPYDSSDENVEIRTASNVDWISFSNADVQTMAADRIVRQEFFVHVAENTTGEDRVGKVTVVALFDGKNPVSEEVAINQSSLTNEISFSVDKVMLSPTGEAVEIPFTANEKPELSMSSNWCVAAVKTFAAGTGIILVEAEPNYTEVTRETMLNASVINGKGKAVIQTIPLVQDSADYRFNLSQTSCTLQYQRTDRYIALEAKDGWKVNPASVPAWLQLDILEGTGDASICLSARNNPFRRPRECNIVFTSNESEHSLILKVNQEANPNGVDDFKYLGKGFDATGIYAHDSYVKASVLDCEKLYQENRIADVLNPNQTNEVILSGSDMSSYVSSYSASASVSAGKWLFHSSVSTNFSESTASSSSHSYATFRHMTKKQIIKINENETAATLSNCLNDQFIADCKTLSGTELITKYGSHVIMGFSLGGVLEYSMAAYSSAFKSQSSMEMAVSAGFSFFSRGASTSSGFTEYQSVARQENGFEERMTCRGGDSQYGTTHSGSTGNYNYWIESLSYREKWVMVDYEGNKLVPLWEFAPDTQSRQKILDAMNYYLQTGSLPPAGKEKMNFAICRMDATGPYFWSNSIYYATMRYNMRVSMAGKEASIKRDSYNITEGVNEPYEGGQYFNDTLLEMWVDSQQPSQVVIDIYNIKLQSYNAADSNFDPIHAVFRYDPIENTLTDIEDNSVWVKYGEPKTFSVSNYDANCGITVVWGLK